MSDETPDRLIDVEALVDLIKQGLYDIAEKEIKGYLTQLFDDVSAFIEANIGKVYRWAQALAEGKLQPHEFHFLVGGLQDLMEMHALSQVGIAKATIQRIRRAVIDLIVTTVFRVVVI